MSANAIQIAATAAFGITLCAWSWQTPFSTVTKSPTTFFAWLQQRFIQFFSSSRDVEDAPTIGVPTNAVVRPQHENCIMTTARGDDLDSLRGRAKLRALRIQAENLEARVMNHDGRINALEDHATSVQIDLANGRKNIALNRVAINAQGDMLKRGEKERKEIKQELAKVKMVTEEHKMCFYIYSLTFLGILWYLSANGY